MLSNMITIEKIIVKNILKYKNQMHYNKCMDFVGIDKLSLLDYEDKVACVLFSKACNFRCPFCHNGLTVLDSEYTIPWNQVMDYLKLRHGVMDGVVVSGGEPTLMPDLEDKIKDIKSLGLLVKLDTNGTNPDVVKNLIDKKLIDYVAMDIKNCPSKYAVTTGVRQADMDKIKTTIHLLMNSGIEYEFRTTLVEEFHEEDDMYGLGELIKGARVIYLQKFVEREGCLEKGLHTMPEERANRFAGILKDYIKEVKLRGY